MAVRRESVVLSLEDQFTSGMARAAAATALLNRNLHDLDGTGVDASRSVKAVGDESERTSTNVRKSEQSINQLTGRLRLLTDVALTLGPALVPLGAAGVAGVAGMAAQFGALAGGIGVAIGALNGVGDALDAVNRYELDPTAANLEKVAQEMERLGPTGADFVVFLESIMPQLRELQMTARDGFLPGLEEGIQSFLARGTQLNSIVQGLAESMGDLSAAAGEALGGPRFNAFFEYLDAEAGTLLLEFGRSVGYVAEAFANLIVAFAPVSSDFSTGLEGMTRSFAEWSRGLQDNQAFQEFLGYLRESGPAAIKFLGALVESLAAVVEAAAPIGQAVLPVLTRILDVFTAIAGTPVGTALLTTAAAFVAFNRAASVAKPIISGLGDALFLTDRAFNQTGSSAVTAGAKISSALKFGGIVAGIMLVSEAVNSLGTEIQSADVARNLEALARGAEVANFQDIGFDIQVLASSMRTVEEPLLELTSGFGLLGDTAKDKAAKNVDELDQALAAMVEGGNAEQAAAAFEALMAAAADQGVDVDEAARQFDSYTTALENAGEAAQDTGQDQRDLSGDLDVASVSLDKLRDRLQVARQEMKDSRQDARGVAQSFVGLGDSLNDSEVSLGDWLAELEKNAQALREFQRNAKEAGENGLNKGLIKSLQAAGSEGALRMKQLSTATRSEIDRANAAWRDGQGAVKDFVDEVGGVKPKYVTKLEAQVDQAMEQIRQLKVALGLIKDETVFVNVVRRNTASGTSASTPGFGPTGSADGGTVPKTGRPYADRHLYMLADGEEVISNRRGQADRFRPLLKAINNAADGDTVGGPRGMAFGGSVAIPDFIRLGEALRMSDKALRAELKIRERMFEREVRIAEKRADQAREEQQAQREKLSAMKDELQALKDSRDAFAEQVGSNFNSDIFGGGVDLASAYARGDLSAEFNAGLEAYIAKLAAEADGGGNVFSAMDYAEQYAQTLSYNDRNTAYGEAAVGQIRADQQAAGAFQYSLQRLTELGFDGAGFEQLAASGNQDFARYLIGLGESGISDFEQTFAARQAQLDAVGGFAGNEIFGSSIDQSAAAVAEQTAVVKEARDETRKLVGVAEGAAREAQRFNRQTERLLERVEKAAAVTGPDRVANAVNRAASSAGK